METINLMAGVLLILFGLRFLRKDFAQVMGGILGGLVMPSSTAAAWLHDADICAP